MTTPEDFIGYWVEIYHATRLSEEGVPFEAFLQAPHEHLGAYGQDDAPESMRQGDEPLLPAQARVARRVLEQQVRRATPSHTVLLLTPSRTNHFPASEHVVDSDT